MHIRKLFEKMLHLLKGGNKHFILIIRMRPGNRMGSDNFFKDCRSPAAIRTIIKISFPGVRKSLYGFIVNPLP